MSAAPSLVQKKVNSAPESIQDTPVVWMTETGNREKRAWLLTVPTSVTLHPSVEPNVMSDESWTQADEAGLGRWWTRKELSWTHNDQNGYRQLWVRCLLYLQCTPDDVVGGEGNLFNQRGPSGVDATAASGSLWSREFCCELTDPITHHAWRCGTEGGAERRLSMALQYAVILRMNGQRLWKTDELVNDFLKDFLQIFQDQSKKGPVPIRQLHKEARKRFQKRAVRPLCSLSDVFPFLEKAVRGSNNPLHTASTQSFSLLLGDLVNLTKALDGATNPGNGMALYMPTKVMATRVSLPSIRQGLAKYEVLDRWHEVSIKDQQWQMKRRERMALEAMEIDDDDDAPEDLDDSFEPLLLGSTSTREPEPQDEEQRGRQEREEEQQIRQQLRPRVLELQQVQQQLQQQQQQRQREEDEENDSESEVHPDPLGYMPSSLPSSRMRKSGLIGVSSTSGGRYKNIVHKMWPGEEF